MSEERRPGGHAPHRHGAEEHRERLERIGNTIDRTKTDIERTKGAVEVLVDISKLTGKDLAQLRDVLGPDAMRTVRTGVASVKMNAKTLETLSEALKDPGVEKKLWALEVVAGAIEIYNADTAKHKAQKAAVVVTRGLLGNAPGIASATGLITAGSGAAAATGLAAVGTTAATVVIPAVAAKLVELDMNTAFETGDLYDKIGSSFPLDPQKHGNLIHAEGLLHDKLKAKGATFDKKGKLDLTQDSNRRIMQSAISEARQELQKVIDRNSSMWPAWFTLSDKPANRASAEEDMRIMDRAGAELDMVRQEVSASRRANAQHHDGPDHGLHKVAKPPQRGPVPQQNGR